MVRAGLIVGLITLVLGAIGAFVLPIVCIPCVALFAGAAAGYLSGQFDRPGASGLAVSKGAQAGAIAGVAALLAHLLGGAIGAFWVGPEGAVEMLEQLGLPAASGGDPMVFYLSTFGTACCLGLFEIALMAGTGALGGSIWFNTAGKSQGGTPPAPAAPAM